VMLASQALPLGRLPLRAGETFEWRPAATSLTAEGETIYFDLATLFTGEAAEGGDTQVNVLIKRVHDARKESLRFGGQQIIIGEPGEEQWVSLRVDDTALTITTDGLTLTAVVKDLTGSSTHVRNTPEELRAVLPARIAEMFDGIEIMQEDGRYVLKGGAVEGQSKSAAEAHSKSSK
jgi:hypothetical protein